MEEVVLTMTQFLTFVFVLGLSILVVATVGWGAGPGFDSDSKDRAVTLAGFSPRVSFVREERETNAQALDYDRNRAELSFVRQF